MSSKTTDNLSEGSNNLYYTEEKFNTSFSGKSTNNLTEGSNNLYHTDARARDAISVTDSGGDGLTYNSSTGAITYTGPSATDVELIMFQQEQVSIADGEISIGQPVAMF